MPLNLTSVDITYASAALVWSQPSQPNGVIIGYKIFLYQAKNYIRRVVFHVTNDNVLKAKLQNLQPQTQYNIKVSSIS